MSSPGTLFVLGKLNAATAWVHKVAPLISLPLTSLVKRFESKAAITRSFRVSSRYASLLEPGEVDVVAGGRTVSLNKLSSSALGGNQTVAAGPAPRDCSWALARC